LKIYIIVFITFALFSKIKADDLVHFSNFNAQIKYVYPTENQVVFYDHIRLQWNNKNPQTDQRLQVSCHKDFTYIILDTVLQGESFVLPKLEKNREFYWRIFADSSKTKASYQYFSFCFFKTTSLHLHDIEMMHDFQIIPSHIGNIQLLYVDNPNQKQYTISIFDIKNRVKVLEVKSKSSYQCIRTQNLVKGSYLMKLQIDSYPEKTAQEIRFTQAE